MMAHAQKPDFVFLRNGRVHLNRLGRQFSRLLAAEVCASAGVMLVTPCSEIVWRVLAANPIRQFPLHFPSLRHRVPSRFNWTLPALHWNSSSQIYTCCMLSSGLFPGVWILCADVSEHSVPSSKAGGCVKNELDLGMLGYYMRKGLARS